MKTRLNIICLLIFAAIIGSVINLIDAEAHDFMWGFRDGFSEEPRSVNGGEIVEGNKEIFLSLKPGEMGHFSDSVYNEVSSEWMPLQYREVVVHPNGFSQTTWSVALISVMLLIIVASTIVQMITFVRLIYAVNKSVIFDWGNILKLRIISISMLVSFVAYALYSYVSYLNTVHHIHIKGYIIAKNDMWDFSLLIPGLCILLIAEIFAIGLRMKEEQELTI